MNLNKIWEQNYHQNQHILHVGCKPSHAYFIPFGDRDSADTGERENSSRFVSLCGDWDFRYYPTLALVEEIQDTRKAAEKWDTLPVPMSWQMALGRGYDLPAYRDLNYPFPVDPPFVSNCNPCGLYHKVFTLTPQMLSEKHLTLVFEGVDSCFYLYINDSFIPLAPPGCAVNTKTPIPGSGMGVLFTTGSPEWWGHLWVFLCHCPG